MILFSKCEIFSIYIQISTPREREREREREIERESERQRELQHIYPQDPGPRRLESG